MAKVKIHVAKAFRLLGKDGTVTAFAAGNHTVDQEVADHWFVKAHTSADNDPVDEAAGAKEDAEAKPKAEAEAKPAAKTSK
ncbi:hypothetical protein NDR89_19585 [Cupriavidus gilardii]|uniref:Uncharacterized protein n=1 Tax=Cupriavidus gilardii TaxID=82541 RepID=A0ABY4VPA2_9BURK|nr:hypothetical protein [Cupriavidus gilardii]USE78843.1 hypothetical protein NDR89_19585 [Cupriavidus gilardii]